LATIYKRGGVWWVRFRLNGHHVRRSAHTGKKAEAQLFLQRLLDEYAAKARGDRPRHRWPEAVERYFEEASIKPKTRACYQTCSRTCSTTFGDLYLDGIGRKVIGEFVGKRSDLYRLSRILGHTTLQMSARYGHLRTDDLHDELRRLEDVAQKRSHERLIEADNDHA
jgi:hypothetical protein